jgi:hypothetical protein
MGLPNGGYANNLTFIDDSFLNSINILSRDIDQADIPFLYKR